MTGMIEYDLLLIRLRMMITENLYCEDDKLFIKSKLKYDIVNMMNEIDSKFMKELFKDLEYNNGVII